MKRNSLKQFIKTGKLIISLLSGLAALFIVAAIVVLVLVKMDTAWVIVAALAGIGALLIIAALVYALMYQNKSHQVFIEQAYKVSKHNIESFKDHSKVLKYFDDNSIEEFQDLNKSIKELSEEYESTSVSVKKIDLDNCGVEFIGESENIVEYDSLYNNITKLILNAQSFRNAVIAFSYELGEETIKPRDAKNILDLIIDGLKYPNLLVAENKDERGFLAFLPYFDSVNQLNEELEELIQHISLIKRSPDGKEMVLCHVAVAVYPYSGVNDIMRDLSYAMKQTKLINFFLPERPVRPNKDLLQSSMNLNNICKFYEKFSALKPNLDNIEESFKEMRKIIVQVNNYYRFSCCGMLEYSDAKDAYVCTFASNMNGHDIFQEGSVVRRKYIDALKKVADKDSSYYFSNRVHINNDIAQFVDVYEIASGQFFAIKSGERVVAVLYFLNYDKEINYDSYLREALLVFSHFIGSYYKEIHDKRTTQVTAQSFADVLKISNTMLYTINPETHRLLFMSDALQSCLPKAKCGKQCFKTIYGLTAPCTDCPLKNKRKHMIQKIRRTDYETSIAFNSLDENQCQLLMRPVDKRYETRDRYDQDLLVHSYYSFYDNLDNEFISSGKGYVLLLSINNIEEMVKSGNKAYVYCLREFGEAIRTEANDIDNLYIFGDDTLALILPTADRNVVINTVEKIYELSQKTKLKEDGEIFPLKLTYTAVRYTHDLPTVDEYIKYLQKVLITAKKRKTDDMLTFVDTGYSRCASREQNIVNIIDKALNEKSFHIKMQPVVDNITRRIYGAELLIRLDDEYRSQVLSAAEVIKYAEANNRVVDISNALIGYIGNLYKNYGYTFFKSIGFDRLSMNTDFSYFNDKSFLEKLNDLATKYSVPKNFLALEITEGDMYNSYEDFAQITQKVISCNTALVCDQYTGELLTPTQIKELGFTEVKIARSLIKDVVSDDQKLSRVVQLFEACHKIGLKVALVGVETKEQEELLSAEMREIYIQGNYFYAPLDEDTLLDELRKANYYEDRVMND